LNTYLSIQDAIDRVIQLTAEERLTGVIDDRGKFIYITMDELSAVAKYIRQHGRVAITDLAKSSNSLINLNPDNIVNTGTDNLNPDNIVNTGTDNNNPDNIANTSTDSAPSEIQPST
jgi:hypothetical protein